MAKYSKSKNPETRARKAERKADNIRKYYGSDDAAAERRARKAETRAHNIRSHHGGGASRPSTRGGNNSDSDAWSWGCAALIILAILWFVIQALQKFWAWWTGNAPWTWMALSLFVFLAFRYLRGQR